MEITSNRIAANPRSKYMKYVSGSSSVIQSQSNIDISNFLKLSGEEDQTVEGNLATTGDIVAYKVSDTPTDVILPIASTTALGVIKVGTNLTISEDGTLNAEAGGGGITEVNWNEIIGTPS